MNINMAKYLNLKKKFSEISEYLSKNYSYITIKNEDSIHYYKNYEQKMKGELVKQLKNKLDLQLTPDEIKILPDYDNNTIKYGFSHSGYVKIYNSYSLRE